MKSLLAEFEQSHEQLIGQAKELPLSNDKLLVIQISGEIYLAVMNAYKRLDRGEKIEREMDVIEDGVWRMRQIIKRFHNSIIHE